MNSSVTAVSGGNSMLNVKKDPNSRATATRGVWTEEVTMTRSTTSWNAVAECSLSPIQKRHKQSTSITIMNVNIHHDLG